MNRRCYTLGGNSVVRVDKVGDACKVAVIGKVPKVAILL